LFIEDSQKPLVNNDSINIEHFTKEVIDYHLKKMGEGKLIVYGSKVEISSTETLYLEIELSFEGHQFIESIKNNTFWNKLKSYVLSSGVGMTIFTLKTAIPIVAEKMLLLK
jgi:hypothetical protein